MSTITTTESLVGLLRTGKTRLTDEIVNAAADRLFAQSMRIQGLIAAASQERQDWAIERKRLTDRILFLEAREIAQEVYRGEG
jgi:hypothetical protein